MAKLRRSGPQQHVINTRRLGVAMLLAVLVAGLNASTGPGNRPPLYFGYFYADGRWGDFTADVSSYTNLYVAIPGGYDTSLDWRPLFQQSLQRAVSGGKSVLLILGDDRNRRVPVTVDAVLAVTAPYWDKVVMIEAAHEEDLSPAAIDQRIRVLKRTLDARGLAHKPFGMTYTRSQSLSANGMRASGVSWVGIEAYVDPPTVSDASACSEPPPIPSPGPAFVPTADCRGWVPLGHPLARLPQSVSELNAFLAQATQRIPPGKQIVLIMMAYDRNGEWRNPETLAALQMPVYLHAYDDPRVTAILMFGYAQPGGTRFYPQLQAIHRQIGEHILSGR